LEVVLVGKYIPKESGQGQRRADGGRCTEIWTRSSNCSYTLWERCAVSAILYDTEAMVLSKVVLEKLDQILHIVARYILQLPKSLARVGGALDAGRILIRIGST
jgi:hypothetical protein